MREAGPTDSLGEPQFPEYEWPERGVLINVVMARVADTPRAFACDGGGFTLRRGDVVYIEHDRGQELATVTAAPAVTVTKKDAAGRDANTAADAAPLGTAPAGTSLLYTITNTGNEPLIDLDLSDAVAANGSVDGLWCVWQDDTVGTTWHGPLAVGASIYCRAALTGVQAGPAHHDTATITATGQYSDQNVDDSDDYYATAMSQPAIDIEKSVSRVMGNVAPQAHVDAARRFRQLLAKFNKARDLIQLGAYAPGHDAELDTAVLTGQILDGSGHPVGEPLTVTPDLDVHQYLAGLAPLTGQGPEPLNGAALLAAILLMWFAPKVATIIDVLCRPRLRRLFGGTFRFLASVMVETAFFLLLSPIMWVGHTLLLAGLPFGRAIGWIGQVRDDHTIAWSTALRQLWPQTLVGAVCLTVLGLMQPAALPCRLRLRPIR